MTREIELTNGLVALVDDEDYKRLAAHRWRAYQGRSTWYAVRGVYLGNYRSGTIYMHREIMGAERGQMVDHADHNGLNNQRGNLRLTDSQGNNANRRHGYGTSRLLGVMELRHERYARYADTPFKAYIHVKKRQIYLGYFATAEEAGRARDRASLHYFGDMAHLNFPELRAEYEGAPWEPPPRRPRKSE